ncbi:MAG: tRNA lysidine(34) synthetase TilS [Chloroflexi bacterium]|nr:tRNA lysidine(34) synthetase TilS [Chloroflexota bacterium]
MFFVLLNRVRAYATTHGLLNRGERLAVGVSGGPDSMALLHILTRLRSEYDLKLIAAHLHHGLRPEADGDADFVNRTASAWDVECIVERADVAALARSEHLSIEEAGRKARYESFARAAPKVAVAHNADDQAETVLMHFLRGSGTAGLRGMLPISHQSPVASRPLAVIRPLLSIPRIEIEAYLSAHELDYRIDSTNADTTFFRNRLRHELIPFLETYNPNIRQILIRAADVIAGEHELLRALIETAWNDTTLPPPSAPPPTPHAPRPPLSFDLSRYRSLPLALQRALLREAVHRLRPDARNVDFAPIDAAAHWAQSAESGHTADLLGGLCLRIVGSTLSVASWDSANHPTTQPPNHPTTQALSLPGTTAFLSHAFTATLLDSVSLADIESNPDPFTAFLNADLASFALRTRRPGDRFRPLGMDGSMKLSDFMINRKIPVDERDSWPLVCCGENAESVLWVCGSAVSEMAKVSEGTKKVIRIECRKLND